jgi:PIN domain
MICVVLDTNVLVSANLNVEGIEALVVSLVLNRKIEICVSAAILGEYERVLLYPRLKFIPKEVASEAGEHPFGVRRRIRQPFLGMCRNRSCRVFGHRQQAAFPQAVEDHSGGQRP